MNREEERSTEELRKLRAESNRLEAEATKLEAEATRFDAEAAKLEAETQRVPRNASLDAVKVGLAAFASILAALKVADALGWL